MNRINSSLIVSAFSALLLVGSAHAYTITFDNQTSGSLGGQQITFDSVWRWESMYGGGSGHLHSGTGNPSPGMYIHGSCCSTPYRLSRTDGATFDLSSVWGDSSASGNFSSNKGGSQSISSGTNNFSGNAWTGVSWVEWSSGGGSIDNVVVNACSGNVSVAAGGPYTVNEGGSVTVTASSPNNTVSSYAWDLDGNGSFETSGASVTFAAGSYDGPGSRVISVEGSSNCGNDTAQATVNINNVSPSISSVSAPNGIEGGAISFSASATDPGPDTLNYTWDFGDGTAGVGASVQHSYQNEGVYSVVLTVSDGDGGTATQNQTVTVSNADPVLSAIVGDATGAEGEQLSWTAVASDPGSDTLTYSWSFGDGSPGVSNSTLPVASHTYVNEGSYQVSVVVSDGDGGTTTSLLTVVVSNAAPLLSNLTGTTSGQEGDSYSYSVQAADAGSGDVLSYSWNFGDGSAPVVTTTGQVTHVFTDDGTFGVTVTVTDNASPPASDSAMMLVTVSNVAPSLSVVNATGGNEGESLTFSAAATDVGSDTLVYTWEMGDGTTLIGDTVTHAFADNGSYPMSLVVSDGDGGSDSSTATLLIANVAPTITSATMPGGAEGQSLVFGAAATDPGADTLVYTWDFDDGSTGQGDSLTHTFTDNGSYTVELTVDDGDGGITTTASVVTITNVAPVIDQMTGPALVDEGAVHTFTAVVSDPASDDMSSMSYNWNWGDGTADSSGASPDHAFPDDGNYTVVLTVDDGTETVTQLHQVQVDNVAPELSSIPPATAEEGMLYTYLPVVVDPGDEVFVWSLAASAPAGMSMDASTGELSWTPAYADSVVGSFAVTLSVDDGDGASDGQTWTIQVTFTDADGDGISDTWEDANGLDSSDPSDGNADNDGDGVSNADEYAAGQDPNSFDGPEAPTPVSPLTGEESAEERPDLVVLNAVDPQGDTLLYEFEIYADDALLVAVSWSGWIAEEEVETFWMLDVPLEENQRYWWRARAADPWVEGPWSEVQDFLVNTVNEAPEAPRLVYPVAEQVVADPAPSLQWAPANDVDEDQLTYSLTVFAADLETVVAQVADLSIPAGEVNGSWQIDVALEEDLGYAWTATATDEHGLAGEAALPELFFYTLSNGAPEGIELVSPADGSSVADPSPVLVATAGSDPEEGPIVYHFEVDSVASFDGSELASSSVEGAEGETVEWDLAADGLELGQNAVAYARVWGVDEAGISSVPHTISFEVRGDNDPPAVPTLLAPEDGATADSVTPALEAAEVEDPEGDLVFYDFVVARDLELTDIVAGGEGLGLLGGTGPLGNQGATSWRVDQNLDGDLYWSARAVDEYGAASEWALPFAIKVEGGEPEVEIPPDVLGGSGPVDCSCSSSLVAVAHEGQAGLLALLLLPALSRRRRR